MRQIQSCSRSKLWIYVNSRKCLKKISSVTYKLLITSPCLCHANTGVVLINEIECEEWVPYAGLPMALGIFHVFEYFM